MGEFKGTRGNFIVHGIVEDEFMIGEEFPRSDIAAAYVYDSIEEARENANLIRDAFNVRQSVDCELPELLERHNSMLDMLKRVNESLLNDSSTIEQIELREEIELLIKKVEE